jgi:hypothetical protein
VFFLYKYIPASVQDKIKLLICNTFGFFSFYFFLLLFHLLLLLLLLFFFFFLFFFLSLSSPSPSLSPSSSLPSVFLPEKYSYKVQSPESML